MNAITEEKVKLADTDRCQPCCSDGDLTTKLAGILAAYKEPFMKAPQNEMIYYEAYNEDDKNITKSICEIVERNRDGQS